MSNTVGIFQHNSAAQMTLTLANQQHQSTEGTAVLRTAKIHFFEYQLHGIVVRSLD